MAGKDLKAADQLTAKLRAEMQKQSSSYRELALKMFPHVCGRCGREFEGKKLKELTVHHIDHNHDNNLMRTPLHLPITTFSKENDYGLFNMNDAEDLQF
jgi:hypothetical protein